MKVFEKIKNGFPSLKFIFLRFWLIYAIFFVSYIFLVEDGTSSFKINEVLSEMRVDSDLSFYVNEGVEIEPEMLYQAIEHYISIGESVGFDEYLLGNIAACYFSLGNYEKSINFYNQAIEKNPLLYTFYFDKGIIYIRLKQYKEALVSFDQSVSLVPETITYYINFFEKLNGKIEKSLDFSQFSSEKKAEMQTLLLADFYSIQKKIIQDMSVINKELKKIRRITRDLRLNKEIQNFEKRLLVYQERQDFKYFLSGEELDHDPDNQGSQIVNFYFRNFRSIMLFSSLQKNLVDISKKF